MKKTIFITEYRDLLAWLRNNRKQQHLSMRELAKRLDVHHSWIGRIEQGERRLDIVEYIRLCSEIGCDPLEGLKIVKPTNEQL